MSSLLSHGMSRMLSLFRLNPMESHLLRLSPASCSQSQLHQRDSPAMFWLGGVNKEKKYAVWSASPGCLYLPRSSQLIRPLLHSSMLFSFHRQMVSLDIPTTLPKRPLLYRPIFPSLATNSTMTLTTPQLIGQKKALMVRCCTQTTFPPQAYQSSRHIALHVAR